jgi:hypothetical protein
MNADKCREDLVKRNLIIILSNKIIIDHLLEVHYSIIVCISGIGHITILITKLRSLNPIRNRLSVRIRSQ